MQSLLMQHFWWYKNSNIFWKKFGNDVTLVQCPFNKKLKFEVTFFIDLLIQIIPNIFLGIKWLAMRP